MWLGHQDLSKISLHTLYNIAMYELGSISTLGIDHVIQKGFEFFRTGKRKAFEFLAVIDLEGSSGKIEFKLRHVYLLSKLVFFGQGLSCYLMAFSRPLFSLQNHYIMYIIYGVPHTDGNQSPKGRGTPFLFRLLRGLVGADRTEPI